MRPKALSIRYRNWLLWGPPGGASHPNAALSTRSREMDSIDAEPSGVVRTSTLSPLGAQRAGSVGPKRARTRVPAAAARWLIPESLPM